LEQVILKEIRRLTKFASQYENEFAKLIMGLSRKSVENDKRDKQRELNALFARDKELDTLFNRMYEDNIAGKIDDERFARMSKSYTTEQAEISEKVKILQAELEKFVDREVTADMFISAVRRYARAKTLTAEMLNELIDKIEVFHTEKVDGENVQRLKIYYNCVGDIEIPDLPKLPSVDVTVNARQGVDIVYLPKQKTA